MIFGSDKITFTVIRYILVEFQETSVSDILFSHMYRKKRRFWKKTRLHLNIHIYCLGNVLWTEIFTSVQILMQQNMAVFNINCLLPTGEVIQQNINVMFYRLTAEIKFVSILNQNTCFEFYQFWHFKKRKSELGNFFFRANQIPSWYALLPSPSDCQQIEKTHSYNKLHGRWIKTDVCKIFQQV